MTKKDYKKTILMTMLIVPLFTAGIAVGGIQNAYAGGIIIIIISPPVITAPDDVTAECNEPGGASGVDLGTPTVEDPDDNDLPPTNDAVEPFSLGDTTVTWTVEDTEGASDSDTQTVTVVDTTPPEITVPDGFMTIANTDGGWSGDIGQATATDVCDPDVDIDNNAPDVFPLGDTVVTWCATDDSGNAFCATQIINVKPLPVDVDIKPGSDPNSVNSKSKGVLPVAILTTDTFDATTVDPGTVIFDIFEINGSTPPNMCAIEDVDGDGDLDLICHFSIPDIDKKCQGIVDGRVVHATGQILADTFDGLPIQGLDSIRWVQCPTIG